MQAIQLNLFGADLHKTTHNGLRDPAFAENKNLPIHRWVPWIAGYSAQFVDDVMMAFGVPLSDRDCPPLVLDPFADVGTTLVQAMLRGCSTVGFEINPYAALAARVKVQAPWISLSELRRVTEMFQQIARRWRSDHSQPRSRPPHGFRSRIPFFSPPVEHQVLRAIDFINDINQPDIRDLFRVALGSVMVSFSNYSYEPSLGTRPGAGKPLVKDADVAAVLASKIRQMTADIHWVQEELGPQATVTQHQVFNADFLTRATEHLCPNSVDLMITSPPYLNNYHYVRNTRPQLFWLSLVHDTSTTKQLEESSFGKFWQTVRTAPPIEPQFDHGDLVKLVQQLRQTRADKGPYGGPGWANYVTAYFNDCGQFLRVLQHMLRPGGVGVVVIGNSIIQGIEFKVDVLLSELAEWQGFIVEEVRPIREKRVGASITQSAVRRGEQNEATLYEAAVTVRKG
jgi:hypothetical protein